jgi:iron-regulated transporter 1
MNTKNKILLSRFVTFTGDQAWDLAVPLTLVALLPDNLSKMALIYFFVRLIGALFAPKMTGLLDILSRKRCIQIGTGLQIVFIIVSIFIFNWIVNVEFHYVNTTLLILSLAACQLGAALMETAVGYDVAIDILSKDELTSFNARSKQLDLMAEVGSPVLTGLMLYYIQKNYSIIAAISTIGILNAISFLFEFFILNSAVKNQFERAKNTGEQISNISFSEIVKLPVFLVATSYALLWFSALSPHGVMLTSYLKNLGSLNDFELGIFRGLGAVFGIIPTFLFPYLKNRYGLYLASFKFLTLQFLSIVMTALFVFNIDKMSSLILFLFFILVSRIGLYGFSLGQTEIRQNETPSLYRGKINGYFYSMTQICTLSIFAAGIFLKTTSDFQYLIFSTVIFVGSALFCFKKLV